MNVARLREQLGLTQAQFGNLFGVHPMTVSKWEREILEPSDYQKALMIDFEKAAKNEEVPNKIGTILISAGIAAALYFLLKYSRNE